MTAKKELDLCNTEKNQQRNTATAVWIKKTRKKRLNYVDVATGMIAHMLNHTAVLQAWAWTLINQPARTNFISRTAISVEKRRKMPKVFRTRAETRQGETK